MGLGSRRDRGRGPGMAGDKVLVGPAPAVVAEDVLMLSTYRIFTNDRGRERGVVMYSALLDVKAESPEAARRKCPRQFDAPYFAPAVAIHWPEEAQSDKERAWLKKHVG